MTLTSRANEDDDSLDEAAEGHPESTLRRVAAAAFFFGIAENSTSVQRTSAERDALADEIVVLKEQRSRLYERLAVKSEA